MSRIMLHIKNTVLKNHLARREHGPINKVTGFKFIFIFSIFITIYTFRFSTRKGEGCSRIIGGCKWGSGKKKPKCLSGPTQVRSFTVRSDEPRNLSLTTYTRIFCYFTFLLAFLFKHLHKAKSL